MSKMLPTQCNCPSDNQFRYPQPIIPPDLREKPRRPVNSDVMRHKTVTTIILASCVVTACEKTRLDLKVKELCAKDGGIRVYETVALPPEKFDKYGAVHIPSKRDAKPADEYYYELDIQYLKTGNPEMSRSDYRIVRRSDGKVLGEMVRYGRGGGDMPGPWHESSFTCPPIAADQPTIEGSVFLKKAR